MRYALYDLEPGQFEKLTVGICEDLFGPGVQGFATGPDAGRDAKFFGVAQKFPSSSSQLSGTTIIQSKHTIDPVGKFSDSAFCGTGESSVLTGEIPRIAALRSAGKLDHYVLFSNRRLGSIANEAIVDRIRKEANVDSVHLIGIEAIERYLSRLPHLALQLSEFEFAMPLRVTPDDLAAVITTIAAQTSQIDWSKARLATPLERVAFSKKNAVNGLSEDYAKLISRGYLKNFNVIKEFLADPTNVAVLQSYQAAVDEFAAKLTAHRRDFDSYDKLLEYLLHVLFTRDVDLAGNKKLTRTVVYYMYWACDIGTEAS